MIKLNGINKFFNKGKSNEIHVINDVSIDLPDKGMVAIFGQSGCGKTTLLNVIGGLDRFEKGDISIDNQSIQENTDDIRNKYIGYIFQNYNLNKLESCFENVADALYLCGYTDKDKDEIEKRVDIALKNVGMDKYASRTPDTLSGGQQQRIAIARAIVKNPKIILADEPTGNLDEANTVMVMDLLRSIAKDHLVLLVTHEANLVDYYCDTVIELKDGKINHIRNNDTANGYRAKDKNDIYLGEFEKTDITDLNSEKLKAEYYGEAPSSPIKLKIINSGGKLYVKIDSEKVQILDDSSEVKLIDGVYSENEERKSKLKDIDMAELPPIKESKKLGRLFNFKSSVKSGFKVNYKRKKKGRILLSIVLFLYAAEIVFTSAYNGKAINLLLNANDSYNHNTFYLESTDKAKLDKLYNAYENKENGIDFMSATPYIQDFYINFNISNFETFSTNYYSEGFTANTILMDLGMIKDAKLLQGRKDNLKDNEIVISSALADKLLEKSNLSYIKDYNDITGLVSRNIQTNGESITIVGIVEAKESAMYFSEIGLANYILHEVKGRYQNVSYLKNSEVKIKNNEAVVIANADMQQGKLPSENDSINIYGHNFKVSEIHYLSNIYEKYLNLNGIEKLEIKDYFRKVTEKEFPDIEKGSAQFEEKVREISNERYFEYFDYYYSEIDNDIKLLDNSYRGFESWLYAEKGIESAKHVYYIKNEEYFKASVYKEENGEYPSYDDFMKISHTLPSLSSEASNLEQLYVTEFNSQSFEGNISENAYSYYIGEDDYIKLSKYIVNDNNVYGRNRVMIHSNDVKETESFVNSLAFEKIVNPKAVKREIISGYMDQIIIGSIGMLINIAIMSVCMYFIMRSSLMSRIKEVGIYRAIGVTKKNLRYHFLIESAVLTTLTVFTGYVCTSLLLRACYAISPLTYYLLFYPHWFSFIILIMLYAICLLAGLMPINSLLRKTPSEILAKYDI